MLSNCVFFFFITGILDDRWKSLYPGWTSYDPVSLLTFPGRSLNNIHVYYLGTVADIDNGKICRVLWLVFFLFEAIFYVQIYLFKFVVAPIFFHKKTTDMLFIPIYFSEKAVKTEFQKPF